MFKTIYVLKLQNKKYLNNLLKYHVTFYKIKEDGDTSFLYVNKEDYLKLKKYFDIYHLSLDHIEGFLKYKKIIQEKIIFIIFVVLGIGYLYLLSNMIFDVEIMSTNEEIVRLLQNELMTHGIKKYHLVKNYDEKEKIKEEILNNYKDKIEWLEIERIGTKYVVHVLERIIKEEKEYHYQSVVAKKNAVILEIKASSGQIVKKVNDYVNKGETIISGYITKKDEIKDIVEASGMVYGETWYNIKVELPYKYLKEAYTGNSYHELSLNIFDKRVSLIKKKYQDYEYEDTYLLKSNLLPFSITYSKVSEIKNDYLIYDYQEALTVGLNKAREKLLEIIDKNSRILYQKKLKLYEENSRINVEVFFKVYEDITDYLEIGGELNERTS